MLWRIWWTNCCECLEEVTTDREGEEQAKSKLKSWGWHEVIEDGEESGEWLCPECVGSLGRALGSL